jgi:hypothetical protein
VQSCVVFGNDSVVSIQPDAFADLASALVSAGEDDAIKLARQDLQLSLGQAVLFSHPADAARQTRAEVRLAVRVLAMKRKFI